MTWTTPTDKATGDLVTAASWNSFLGTSGDMSHTSAAVCTTAGDMAYASSANHMARIAGGPSGYILTSNGATSAPSWQAAASGGITMGKAIAAAMVFG
jgi:hypothetical protein